MLGYVIQRLILVVGVLIAVSVLVFAITSILPGNVAYLILGPFAAPEQVKALEIKLGLNDPHKMEASREFIQARKDAEHDAHRTDELINRFKLDDEGKPTDPLMIPKQGAVYLLRNDPKTRGPRLFKQHCASCHSYYNPADPEGKDGPQFLVTQGPQTQPDPKNKDRQIVVRDADKLSFAAIEKAVAELATKARNGKINVSDLQGGTFTITNGGVFGSLLSTPILNPPQTAILGLHAIQKRPVVVNDEIVVRPMMYLAMTYDHRLIDGREAVQFLLRVKDGIENPERLMLEI